MLKDRSRIERQLTISKQKLSALETKLAEKNISGKKALSRNAVWRHLNANYRQLRRRMIAVEGVEAREAAVAQARAEKAGTPAEG